MVGVLNWLPGSQWPPNDPPKSLEGRQESERTLTKLH
jgi:hypothetical protein